MANIASRTKSSGRCQFAGGGLLFPFAQAYGAPNFNTLLALHSTNMEESTEILTIFPWYSNWSAYLFCARLNSNQAKKRMKSALEYLRQPVSGIQCGDILLLPCKTGPGGVFKLKDTGYPVFRFAKDVIVNNNEVIEEQERMAKLSGMKDTDGHCR